MAIWSDSPFPPLACCGVHAPQLEWTPDCRALAVGYYTRGLVVWSPSGCRLMCTLRQLPGLHRDISVASNISDLSAACQGEEASQQAILESGVSALAWDPMAYKACPPMLPASNDLMCCHAYRARICAAIHSVHAYMLPCIPVHAYVLPCIPCMCIALDLTPGTRYLRTRPGPSRVPLLWAGWRNVPQPRVPRLLPVG